jgi:hypothetical protein
MVVIGIILVLVAIVVLGLRHVNYTAARHETIAEMKICTDLLTEYKNVHGSLGEMATVPSLGGQATSGIEMIQSNLPSYPLTLPDPWGTIQKTTFQLPVYIDSSANPPKEITGQQPQTALLTDDLAGRQGSVSGSPSPSSRDMGDRLDQSSARYYSNAVAWTQAVNYVLLREPKNRSLVSNSVPPKRLLEVPTSANIPTGGTYDTLACAVILDGWGNPIVYVPKGGMHVMLKTTAGLQEYVVRSSGTYQMAILPPVGPNDHPFFASAGQDGVFTDSKSNQAAGADYGIDNVYSFQE